MGVIQNLDILILLQVLIRVLKKSQTAYCTWRHTEAPTVTAAAAAVCISSVITFSFASQYTVKSLSSNPEQRTRQPTWVGSGC